MGDAKRRLAGRGLHRESPAGILDACIFECFPWERLMGVPGDGADGLAAEYVVMSAEAFTHLPTGWSFAQAATLPCAALRLGAR